MKYSYIFVAMACWQSEINPITQAVFTSSGEYDKAVQSWQFEKPKNPGLFNLAIAYDVYKSERDHSLTLGSDKRAHCYMGCRISQATNVETGVYVGWKKEDKDIKDCDVNTHFEPLDFVATQVGAEEAVSMGSSATDCENFCIGQFQFEFDDVDL